MLNYNTVNFTAGRTIPISRIVFHCTSKTREQLQAESCKKAPMRVHTSYHYAIFGDVAASFVKLEDTAWGFGVPADDANAIHIAIYDPRCGLPEDESCQPYKPSLEFLQEILCQLNEDYGVLPYEIHNNELQNITLSELVALGQDCPADPVLPPATTCLPIIAVTDNTDLPFVLSDNNCLYTPVTTTTVLVCNRQVVVTNSLPSTTVTSLVIDGVATVFPTPITPAYPAAANLVSYLNTLGVGTFIGSYIGGTTASFTYLLTLVSPTADVTDLATSIGAFTFADNSDCQPVINQEPITLQDLLPVPPTGLTKAHGAILLTNGQSLSNIAQSTSYTVTTISGTDATNYIEIINNNGTNGRIEHDGISITVGTAARNIALEDWTIIAHGTALASVHYTTI